MWIIEEVPIPNYGKLISTEAGKHLGILEEIREDHRMSLEVYMRTGLCVLGGTKNQPATWDIQ